MKLSRILTTLVLGSFLIGGTVFAASPDSLIPGEADYSYDRGILSRGENTVTTENAARPSRGEMVTGSTSTTYEQPGVAEYDYDRGILNQRDESIMAYEDSETEVRGYFSNESGQTGNALQSDSGAPNIDYSNEWQGF